MSSLAEHRACFEEVERAWERDVEAFGLPFEAAESCERSARTGGPWSCENACSSLRRGWISPACLACRKGERTATFFVSLRCRRSCYFCFNPNQQDYERFLAEERDIAGELRAAHVHGARFECLAVTGGEPFLHPERTLAFLECARELYPHAYTRVYTCGDFLDEGLLGRLAEAGLDELRFSVKLDDPPGEREAVFDAMAQAVLALPAVVVEMPVIPGTLPQMEDLLARIDGMGVRGINLLEFCFPFCNAEEFTKRGFKLRKRPFQVLYDYWYAGGVPVAGSEAEALALMRFAEERGLNLGVHYCSSDNKNTGQVFQQNSAFVHDAAFASAHPWLTLDADDRFLKCARAFGDDARRIAAWLEEDGRRAGWERDGRSDSVSFPIAWLDDVRRGVPGAEAGESWFVLESEGKAKALREVECLPV